MKDLTPDICDQYEDKVTLLDLDFAHYGKKSAFCGEIVTVRCYHDNSKVREVLQESGNGKVLFVDGNGSCQKALLGDQVAELAVKNGWEGVIIYGAIRDAATISEMDIAVKALGTCPLKTEKKNVGEINVSLTVNNQMIQPGDYLYADWNGVVMSKDKLEIR
ncbi:putative 4-hydroxy-4-methyl-2-oxoglutarate aldolase [Vibrio sp. S4M6]|uniref:putative 4-hydroxy-4-methyl-2-oxoglutarate aldolase n=1 Tax=Vibrio sinus TaxID=2946865 RepID=UPI00202A2A2A|nr:putative 4-hydroxy-4-methyl-2-oxoglutarate aldolase [Vibrio sinus]MCL9781109.1 putative 4-hydroxy-4-methyl-2-oxoglutarate aldolase [Vibrio sinus]